MKNLFISAGIVAALALGVFNFSYSRPPATEQGQVTVNPDGSVNVGGSSLSTISSPYLCVGGQCEYYAKGSCNAATTTIMGLANPWSATSTAELLYLRGTGQATTTTLYVGTTTRATGLTLSAVHTPYFINGVSIATTTAFHVVGGVQNGPTNTFVAAGSGAIASVVVAPGTFIGAFATTTATGAGAAGFTGGFTDCEYLVKWTRGF